LYQCRMRALYMILAAVAVGLVAFIWWQESDMSRAAAMDRPLPNLREAQESPMTSCRACKKEISRRAVECVHCGEPRERG
jgi:hypothetical protein